MRLEGEAYFKVANQSSAERRVPFIVHTERQRIEVTGTEFNVMAHPDEPHTHTTLIEGKVNVSVGPETVGLDPGQQAVSNRQGMKVQAVEVARFIAWKDNEFYFSETPLGEAISELSRWYDFDVVYEGPVPSTHLYGSISRDEGLAEVLRIMKAGGVQFKLEKLGGRSRLIIDKE